jgi:hypothetical protein
VPVTDPQPIPAPHPDLVRWAPSPSPRHHVALDAADDEILRTVQVSATLVQLYLPGHDHAPFATVAIKQLAAADTAAALHRFPKIAQALATHPLQRSVEPRL